MLPYSLVRIVLLVIKAHGRFSNNLSSNALSFLILLRVEVPTRQRKKLVTMALVSLTKIGAKFSHPLLSEFIDPSSTPVSGYLDVLKKDVSFALRETSRE